MSSGPELWDEQADAFAEHLTHQATGENGWAALYRCPATGRLWVEDYPHSERQGGGPRRLRHTASPPEWATDE